MTKAIPTKTLKKSDLKPVSKVVEAIENVVRESQGSQMSEEFMRTMEAELKLLTDFFHITEVQAVLLCLLIELGPGGVDCDDMSNYLGLSKVRMWNTADEIEQMVKSRLIKARTNYRNVVNYELLPAVIKCVQENKSFEQPKLTGLTAEGVFGVISGWFEDLNNDIITPGQMAADLQDLFDNNGKVKFVRQMRKLALDEEDTLLLVLFCHRLVNEEENSVLFSHISRLCSSRSDFFRVRHDLRYGRCMLQRLKLIDYKCHDGIVNTGEFRLTEAAKAKLLSEFELNESEERVSGLLDHHKLTEKQLYFTEDIGRRLTDLEELLQQDNFLRVQGRMREKGLRNGFAVLLYGGPGTGKTETVYQLARKTGRDIMVVDIPSIRDKYVGESEKHIKAVFNRYRALVKKSKIAPILLFNEADAIIGQRRSGADRALDQMENAMQNIILQELETLDGILIATTNLQQNLDKAFERRFLYKIKFERPSEEARASIWRTMIPELAEDEIHMLAARYDFSGGQIENIARLYNIDRILHDDCGLDQLIEHCDNERLDKENGRPRIGF